MNNNSLPLERAKTCSRAKKILRNILSLIANSIPMSMGMRAGLYRKIGVNVGKDCLLGQITVDGIYPEDVHIGDGCTITKGVVLLTHFYDTKILTNMPITVGLLKLGIAVT